MNHCFRLLLLTLLVGSTISCAKRQNDPVKPTQANLDAAIEQVQVHHIAQVASDFYFYAGELAETSEEFCSAASEAQLTALQESWKRASETWFALANYKFGPLVQSVVFSVYTFVDSYRVRGTNYTESVRTELDQDLNGEFPLDEAYYQAKTFQFLGLLPLELLLFETVQDTDESVSAILSEFQQVPRKCQMLIGQAEHLLSIAQRIHSGWQENYLQSGVPYYAYESESADRFAEILTAVQEHLDYLHKRNVIDNVAVVSGHNWSSIEYSILDIQRLLEGDAQSSMSLFGVMVGTGNSRAVEEVKENLNFALTSISEKDKVNLQLALTLLDGNFKRTIPDALEVNLGINFSDGD